MTTVPDNEFRLRLRVTLKLMAAFAAVACIGILVPYFAGNGDRSPLPDGRRVTVADLAANEARTILWGSRPVIVLRRRSDSGQRPAADARWFVAYASDTVRGCPIRWHGTAGEFRSTCGDTRYDAKGEAIGGDAQALRIPPYRVTADGVLVLGTD